MGISITSLFSFFSGEKKSIKRGENHYRSEHVLSFSYCEGELSGRVKASMKDKAYKTTVRISDIVSYFISPVVLLLFFFYSCGEGEYKIRDENYYKTK